MDKNYYKEQIQELLNKTDDEQVLRRIYLILVVIVGAGK